MSQQLLVESIRDRLVAVRDRLHAVGGDTVQILAVTKSFPAPYVRAAVDAGCTRVGESYAQDLLGKYDQARPWPPVHFIGRLQTNKIRSLVGVVNVYESVDRQSVVVELERRDPGCVVLVQVNATAEPGKGGCAVADVPALVNAARSAGLVVEGLMCVGPTVGGPVDIARAFRITRSLVDQLDLSVCSMGMTDDLEIAVGEGSTQVRVGSALFGQRPARS